MVHPEILFENIKDIQERLEAAQRVDELVQEVPMGPVTLQVKTRIRFDSTISDGTVTVSYGDLQRVLDLCKKEKVLQGRLAAVDANCFQLLTNLGMLNCEQENETSDLIYQVVDLEQIQTMDQTLKWMDLPSEV